MYCNNCKEKLPAQAQFCGQCGTRVVKEEKVEMKRSVDEGVSTPYTWIAFASALGALGLGLFPWPKSWGVGTSTWMMLLILGLSLVSYYFVLQANKFIKTKKDQEIKTRDLKLIKFSKFSATLTTLVALAALTI